jgi:glycoside hydrolase-like protein
MTGILWADYSAGYPGAATLAAAGFSGAIRYIGKGTAGKRLTAAERADFDAHRFPYLLVCELDTHDAEGGYESGKAYGAVALADARAKGVPDSVGIACAADEHLTTAQVPTAVDYARGFRDAVGQDRMGAYGFSEFVAAVRAAGIGTWFWQAGNPPAVTGTDGFVHFWQRNGYDRAQTTTVVGGIECDINVQLRPLPAAEERKSSEMASFYVKLSTCTVDNGVITAAPDCAEQCGPLFTGTDFANAQATVAKGQASMTGLLDQEWDDRVRKSRDQESIPAKLDAVASVLAGLPAAIAAKLPAAGSVDPAALATAVVTELGTKLAA